MENEKRTLRLNVDIDKQKVYTGLRNIFGNKIAFLTLAATVSVGVTLSSCGVQQNYVTIARAVDQQNDEYEGVIPILDEDKTVIGTVPDEDLVIVYGKIKSGNKLVSVEVISTAGETLTGYISSEYLEKIVKISKNKLEEYNVVYSVLSDNGVNIRSSAEIADDNLIGTLTDGEQILGKADAVPEESESSSEESEYTWVPVLYINENTIEEGYIRSDLLIQQDIINIEEIEDEITMVVNTEGTALNVRASANVSSQKIGEIENGTEISISETAIKEMESNGDYEWIKVTLEDGTEGYVAYEYLEDTEFVAGIDISNNVFEDADSLRELLTSNGGALDDNIDEKNTSDIAGKIKFVYIRLGASGYKTFNQVKDEKLEEFVAICEEYGVPYGFYYYSTSITTEEAEIEAKYIKELINSLESTEFNLLPIALDYEIANNVESDRQYQLDLTDVKAYLAYLVEKDYGETIIYGNIRSLYSNKIIDLETYSDKIDEYYCNESGIEIDTENRLVWLAYEREEMSEESQNIYNIIKQNAISIMEQTILDGDVLGYKIDINKIGKSAFELLKSRYKVLVYTQNIENEIENEIEID